MLDLEQSGKDHTDVKYMLMSDFLVTLFNPWPIDVLHVVVVVEVLSQGRSIAQTLQDGVHVACVSKVT